MAQSYELSLKNLVKFSNHTSNIFLECLVHDHQKRQRWRLRPYVFFLFIVIFSFQDLYSDDGKPHWFPKISCESGWEGKDHYSYSFHRDKRKMEGLKGNFGYAEYLKSSNLIAPINREDCYKEWTVLVYMAANNDLTPYAFWDLYEMEASYSLQRAASTISSDLLVDIQTTKNSDLRRLHMFQTSARFDRSKGLDEFKDYDFNDIQSPIAHYHKERLNNFEDQLLDFINWGVRNYPSRQVMVIVWGHGEGWSATSEIASMNSLSGRFGGLAFQYGSKNHLTVPALARVLQNTEQNVDVYASDACLMQMLEVAYELAPFTRYIVGSAQVQSYLGLPYRRMMYEINRGCYGVRDGSRRCREDQGDDESGSVFPASMRMKCGDDKACYVAHMLPRLTKRSFHSRGLQGVGDAEAYKSMTMSSINAMELEFLLTDHMNELSKAILDYLDSISNNPQEIIKFKNSFEGHLEFLGQGREVAVSLGLLKIYLEEKSDEQARSLYSIANEIQLWLNKVTVEYSFGSDYEAENYHLLGFKGLALWVPNNIDTFNGRIDDFKKSRLYKDLEVNSKGMTYWEAWMRALYKEPLPVPL